MTGKFNHLVLIFLFGLSLIGKGEATSAKALGMGNCAIAYPQDSLSATYNPASSLSVGNRSDLWVSSNFSPYDFSIKQNSVSEANLHAAGRRTWTLGSAFGIANQVNSDLALGFVAYNRFFHKTHYNKASRLLGKTKLGRSYEQYCASGLAALRWEEHQFGVSLDLLIGRHKVSGLQKLDHRRFTIAPGCVTSRGYDWNYGLGVTLGWLWNVNPELKIGASFRPETKMSRFHKYKGFVPERGVFHNPQKAMAGFSWRVLPSTTLAFDLKYIWIRRLRADKNRAFSDLKYKLGSKHGTALGLKNDLIVHTGLDYDLTPELILRAGYSYHREVQKKSQSFWDILYCSPIQHYVSLGATYSWNDQLEFDLFYEHGFERKIKGAHAVPEFLGGGTVKMRRIFDRFGVGLGIVF